MVCTVVQTTPGLFQFGAAKPLWLLPLGLAVSALEGEFAGAIFGAVCGLMWDYKMCIRDRAYTIQPGERVAQLCIAPVYTAAFAQADALEETSRGEGGFGSTGK